MKLTVNMMIKITIIMLKILLFQKNNDAKLKSRNTYDNYKNDFVNNKEK